MLSFSFLRVGTVVVVGNGLVALIGVLALRLYTELAPAEVFGGLARNEVGETERDLIAGADQTDRVATAQEGHPVSNDADARRPAEGLKKAVGCPDEKQEIEACAEAKEDIQSGRAEHAQGEHDPRREALGELAVEKLAEAVSDF